LHTTLLLTKNANFLWLPLKGEASSSLLSMHVLSHGSITINISSPTSSPIVDYRALSNPIDLDIMVLSIEFLRRYMSLPDFSSSIPLETNPGMNVTGEALREWIRRNWIPSVYHPTGTAAKIPRERGGVVDEQLLVYGTEGLSVADASIMPFPPGANTQSTVYMIAEKVRCS
jgi:choline dehydrogenase